jgi:hypothetical protein
MEVTQVAKAIEEKIKLLEMGREALKEKALAKAKAISEYEKALTLTIIKLRNGVEFEFEGERIVNPPTTLIEKIAKGICFNEKLQMEEAEAEYKVVITKLEAIEAELNGYQSINRYLSEQ